MRKTKSARQSVISPALTTLYERPLPSTRSGALYSAFPYPTKISPEAIALFIAAHTRPGETVFDGFGGSGTTGIAALLCEKPTATMKSDAARLGLNVTWGARNAVLYELSALGAFIGRMLTHPPDPKSFQRAAEQLLNAAITEDDWLYAAKDPSGKDGTIRYIIWSDELRCPHCRRESTVWDGCVSLRPARIASEFACPSCRRKAPLDAVPRLTKKVEDDLLGTKRALRARRPMQIHGSTGKKTWSRSPNASDLALLRRIAKTPLPSSVPNVTIPWGDLYRSGYHEGITHLHHFYTRRNLIAFTRLWARVELAPADMREALRFWLLSYNASHATIMSRVVAKAGQDELVITSGQPGVLYVSGLPVEKNLFKGLARKLKTITQAFAEMHGLKGSVVVKQHSSCDVHLLDNSIDYAFTDPPFGGNIPYAEVNFINEAWLAQYTDRADEIIVSRQQNKAVEDYGRLMTKAMKEIERILKPAAKATVVFHSSSADVWNALQRAYQDAGFAVERASVLDKTQGSFKQVTTDGAVRGDPLLLLSKTASCPTRFSHSVWTVAERLCREADLADDPTELTAQRLYSRLITHFLTHEQPVPLDADSFYQWLAAKRAEEVHAGASRRS